MNQFHKPDPTLSADAQDKRSVIAINKNDWDQWLHGSHDEALALLTLPDMSVFTHGAEDPAKQTTQLTIPHPPMSVLPMM
ncbi:MAG: hypothetical protein ACRDAM_13735 [Casimicrobium sp.]